MAQQRYPDQRLVYLHCSSIFSGANAQVRRAKKISQLLQKRKAAISILTNEFPVSAVAPVAKELLEERIFESLPRAKLRFPELFQQSETQEAARAASEVEVIRIEAEAVQDAVLTSDNEGGDECLEIGQGESKAVGKAQGTIRNNAERENPQTTSQTHLSQSVPTLHPVYLPFKTQHKTLVLVQHLLEECCLDFGNTWVPDLMEARQWKEAESIELTEWIKRFSKHAKSLPNSAIERIPGKSVAEVLFGTSKLRHSAVHRLPTSAPGLLNMLSAAIDFAIALKDSIRAKTVSDIHARLEASVGEVVQHQNLLECKLVAQLEDIARRRAELDELERLSIEEMLATDNKQRTEVGCAFEGFLVDHQQTSHPCGCSHNLNFDRTKMDSKMDYTGGNSWTEHEQERSIDMNEIQTKNKGKVPAEAVGVANEPEASDLGLLAFESRGRRIQEKKAADYSWANPGPEEGTSQLDGPSASAEASPSPVRTTHETGWGFPPYSAPNFIAAASVASEQYNISDQVISVAPSEPSPRDEPEILAVEEEISSDDVSFAEKASCKESLIDAETPALGTTLQYPPVNPIIEAFNNAEEDTIGLPHSASHKGDNPHGGPLDSDVASRSSAQNEDNIPLHPSPPSAPTSTVDSPERISSEILTTESHTIMLSIQNGSNVFKCIVYIKDCTRTDILNEAKASCERHADKNHTFGELLPESWCLTLMSLDIDGGEADLSNYYAEDLSLLFQTIEKTGIIPRFTLHVSEN
ncbi:MAG: hypothetical protein Q9221_006780 [Calogaya cf. arnoldii]